MEEIWKDIKGYEGLYQVSNLGRVKALKRICRSKGSSFAVKKERIITASNDRYKSCALTNINGDLNRKLIHRLLAGTD